MSEGTRSDDTPIELYLFAQGAVEWKQTSGDADYVVGPRTYSPEYLVRGQDAYSQEDWAGNVEVRVKRSNPITALFISGIPVSPVSLTIYRLMRGDSPVPRFIGTVVGCSFEGSEAVLTCAPISQQIKRAFPIFVVQFQCNLALYSPRCGVSKAAFKLSTTVSSSSGLNVTLASVGGHPDGWFNNGFLELASGDRRYITTHVGSVVTLQRPFLSLPNGTAVDAYPGCDRTEPTCTSKFGNLPNHLGFARVPTRNPYTKAIA
jgi:uncharacterized phage protein (TIGR02218 family)